jgi:nitrogen regulatory protein P-II 1
MFMILFVLHDPEKLDEILTAWEDCGVSGITILPSTGIKRHQSKSALRDELPLIPSMDDILEHMVNLNRTLFTLVKDQAVVDQVVTATESVTGDLNSPNTGILAVLPVTQVFGLNRNEL